MIRFTLAVMADEKPEPLQRISVEAGDINTAFFRAGQEFEGVRAFHPSASYLRLTIDADQAWKRISEEGHDDQWEDA